jgi:hypothetical protein
MNKELQKNRPSCLGVLAAIGTALGILLAVIDGLDHLVNLLLQLPNHFVIQISGFQISIGITVIIALLILLLMGLAFTMGMFYFMFVVTAVFTKQGSLFSFAHSRFLPTLSSISPTGYLNGN